MGQKDAKYKLVCAIELDEGFFSTSVDMAVKDKPRKRGRGSPAKTKVLGVAESTPQEPNRKHKLDKAVGHIKIIVMKT